MPRMKRPSESWSSVAAVIAVIAAVRPGIWKIAEPSLIVVVWPAIQPRIVAASRAVGLGGPDGVVAERLGLLDDRQLVVAW